MQSLNNTQQRYSPLNNYVKNQGQSEAQKRFTANNFIRPSSATTKRKGEMGSNPMDPNNMRQMLAFGPGMNLDSKNKIMRAPGNMNIAQQEYLNGIMNQNVMQNQGFIQTQGANNSLRKSHGFQNNLNLDGRKT